MINRRSTVFLVTAGLICAVATLSAADAPDRATPPSPEDTKEPHGDGIDPLAGVWIWVDPLTGALTPVRPEGVRPPLDPDKRLQQDPENLVPFALREGGRGVRVGGHFVSTFRVEIGADGTLNPVCNQEHDHRDDAGATRVEEAPES